MKKRKDRPKHPSIDRAAPAPAPTSAPAPASAPTDPRPEVPIVGIGASAGGMDAFIEFLQEVPADTGMAFVLIQHLAPTHPSYLSEALARSTKLPVHEIGDGMRIEPDHVYVTPSNADVSVLRGVLTLLPRPPEARPHLPIDSFFKSLAADRRDEAVGVVLSGTGSDGAEGLRAIREAGGLTLAQEPRTAKFSGMPEAAVKTGAVDLVLPIAELAGELLRVGRHPSAFKPTSAALETSADEGELRKVFVILRRTIGIDFSEYKLPSVRRRLARRMALVHLTTLQEYVRLLQRDRAEVHALFDSLLIGVTSFFRDAEAFEALKKHVFPEILKRKKDGGTIRVWSAGCSTGEEAYSLVIALQEFLEQKNASFVPIQLFGTDVSEQAIERARAGVYPEATLRGIGAARLAAFFTKIEGDAYRINPSVRERCAFVRHDLSNDPPFSKLDLVSCRNLLIYFGPELQARVLARLQFGLSEPGFLLLGRAENITDDRSLFTVVDQENKIFARTSARPFLRLTAARDLFPTAPSLVAEPGKRAPPTSEAIRRSETLLLDRYAPPGVIVTERMEILHFRGHTGLYLEPAPGAPQHDLLKMARKGLMTDLRGAIAEAGREATTVSRPGVRIQREGATHLCDLVVIPVVMPPESHERVFAVLFEAEKPRAQPTEPQERATAELTPASEAHADRRRILALEDELKETKDYLQSIIDQRQQTNEELVSANEELLSSNEELQTLNEELETAKEELQSTNEELSTLNEELQTRYAELNLINSDLTNVLGSIEIPLVLVDQARRIRRFTPKARSVLNLLPSDVGRPIDDIKPTFAIDTLDQKFAAVIDTLAAHEEEITDRDGRWRRVQIRPYITVDKKIGGAVLTIVDVDALKRALNAAEWARDYAKATVEATQIPFVVLDDTLKVVSANAAFHETYGLSQADVEGRRLQDLMGGAWDLPELTSALDHSIKTNEGFQKLEVKRDLPRLGARSMSLSGGSAPLPDGTWLVLLVMDDITERRRYEVERTRLFAELQQAKASAEGANRTKDIFLATLSHELRTPLSTLLLQAQLLRRGKNLDEARVQRAGETMERAAMAQARLIEDLLDVSRIVSGKLKLELEPVDLASAVQSAIDEVAPLAEKKRIAFELHADDSPRTVSADPARLAQVVLNLLTNAIKFTPEQGQITVTVDSAEGRGRFRVTDTGVGIDPEFLPHIFERFTQQERAQVRAHSGLGLGLSIVRHIVEAHGGTIEAASAGKARGSSFTVTLPLIKA